MHDPMTMAFEIKSPIKRKSKHLPEGYRNTWITIWHVDPETDHTDDSCGWFMRSRHGDKAVLEKIVKRFEWDWDRVFKSDSGTVYHCGYFCPDGDPHLSVQGIALNLFFHAAHEMFGREKAVKFMNRNLFNILHFAENPVDSLYDGFTRKFEIGCGEKHTEQRRRDRIESTASIIYSWILRETRPWYKHPRWHVHHWKIQWHFWQKLHRWLFERCCKCGKRFTKWGECPISDWNGTRIWHDHCDSK